MKDETIRRHLIALLDGGLAHIKLTDAMAGFPVAAVNRRPENVPHSAWDLVEHMRIAQFDILDFINNPDYKQPVWPDDYWPDAKVAATPAQWSATLDQFHKDLAAIKALAADPGIDLTGPLPHAQDYTYLREILLVADHNAYHIGQLLTLKRTLGLYE